MADCDATHDVGTELGPFVGVLVHELSRAFWIAAPALHDLHEACLVGIALNVDGDISAVFEGRLAVEELGRLGPPLVLFRAIAVAAGILFGFEADNRDGTAIFSDPACAA